jgi:hypothetical protein
MMFLFFVFEMLRNAATEIGMAVKSQPGNSSPNVTGSA